MEDVKVFMIPRIQQLQLQTLYSKPKEVAHFSYTPTRELRFTREALSYYKPAQLPINLNTGYPEKYTKRDGDIEPLDSMLLAVKNSKPSAQFCTWRGIITKIICTPFSLNEGWELIATRYGGTVYLMEHEEGRANQVQYENADLFTYYGYKFEAECTKPSLDSGIKEDVHVNTNVQYCSVFTSKLGKYSLLLGAEVDCLFQKPKSDSTEDIQREYTELKTHKVMQYPNQKTSFIKFKLLKTWAQSFLVGVPRVIFGFRDEKGYIQEVRTYETPEFPRLARKSRLWDPNVCLTFGEQVLCFIDENVTLDDMNSSYRIKYLPETRSIEISGPTSNEFVFIRPDLF